MNVKDKEEEEEEEEVEEKGKIEGRLVCVFFEGRTKVKLAVQNRSVWSLYTTYCLIFKVDG